MVLVACSGGPDSLTLAAATASTARAHWFTAGAVVVDHGWSAEGSAASARAAGQCRELGLDPVELVPVDAGGPVSRDGSVARGGSVSRGSGSRGGPEAVARVARYAALEDAARRHGARAVLLGHTLDDQAETVLLGLGRGSGARSLAGMPARRGLFRRPFLGLRRTLVAEAGDALGLHPWHDPANDDPAYTRVRVRRLAGQLETALGAGTAEALARSADLLRDDADALDSLAADLLALARVAGGQVLRIDGEAVTAALEPLRAALPAVRRRALLAWAREVGCPGGALGHRHALALDRLVTTGRGQVALPGGRTAEVGRA
ncbi:tRNA lysidine(34) synthetase TilS [Kineosporia sp. J2-2]|uniref:tRNA(Ile)-lysidine synthase n=1 Tax=Kineosporia corallincola TaxID=2835133 RepID=A0ABS5TC49_9ACTN|nr:tRNA lysidine(34) synthetase [Kineosporia corallincola]MBT0767698.1 tRNA lysidine(34) synthetase TilS [Kineosporia corallincola]